MSSSGESSSYNSNLDWSADRYIEAHMMDNKTLRLTWDNTEVYKFLAGDGKYDYVSYCDQEEGCWFFLKESGLSYQLEACGYPCHTMPMLDEDIIERRQDYDMHTEAQELAHSLEEVVSVQDFLNL
jgi:hypothetical protein